MRKLKAIFELIAIILFGIIALSLSIWLVYNILTELSIWWILR